MTKPLEVWLEFETYLIKISGVKPLQIEYYYIKYKLSLLKSVYTFTGNSKWPVKFAGRTQTVSYWVKIQQSKKLV
jgi:hypothetical protein